MNTFTKISKSFILAALMVFGVVAAQAQDEESALSISGTVDTYYKYDFSENENRGTWFAEDQGSASIGMVDLLFEKTSGKASFVGEVAFGPRANGARATAPGAVQNLYVSYALSDALAITGGFMGTFVGYEVISPAANFNYSASYLFSNGPFQNAGVKLDYAISDKVGVMVGAFSSAWDSYTPIPGKGLDNFGAQLSISPVDGWDLYINYISGSAFKEFDITTGYQISDAFYLGLNVAQNMEYGDDPNAGFFGAAVYAQLAVSESASLGLRYENFAPEVEANFGMGSINSITLSGNLKAGDLTFIPEFRFDSSSQDDFLDGDGAATGSFAELIFAAVYSF